MLGVGEEVFNMSKKRLNFSIRIGLQFFMGSNSLAILFLL